MLPGYLHVSPGGVMLLANGAKVCLFLHHAMQLHASIHARPRAGDKYLLGARKLLQPRERLRGGERWRCVTSPPDITCFHLTPQVGTVVARSYIAIGSGVTLQGAALSLTAAITLYAANVTRERGGVVNTFTFSSTGSESPSATNSPSISPSQVESYSCLTARWFNKRTPARLQAATPSQTLSVGASPSQVATASSSSSQVCGRWGLRTTRGDYT